ncbi:MAG: YggS family pyridoxal phosphate-dependent enzyme [Candidatus Cloacimonas sp.]|jgi:pyridoxal phosphate enzyme (YggS family)|nr:YggS family pyridoxal phosphate-dependent enzyme [Candidatus Cloacimonas sp.]
MKISENITKIRSQIDGKLKALGREQEDFTLVAVTKTYPVDAIETAISAGIMHIGENKVQEATRKIPLISIPYEGFHFIGHLQSNKINGLLNLKPFLVHSVDSVYIAQLLHKALGRTNRFQDILIQINSSEEESKSGLTFTTALEAIAEISCYSTLCIRGLMTIGKLDKPEVSRPLFRKMKILFDEIKAKELPNVQMDYLSMGMSHDYLIAIEEGANMVRIGSAIFGRRAFGGKA